MNLRSVTIWTTGVALIGTIVFPYLLGDVSLFHPLLFEIILSCTLIWLLSGSPLLVSFFLAIMLRHKTSSEILLASTIFYGICYSLACCVALFEFMGTILLLGIGIMSLPVMIPVWISALRANAYNTPKTP